MSNSTGLSGAVTFIRERWGLIAGVAVLGCAVTAIAYLIVTFLQHRAGTGSGWREVFDQQEVGRIELEKLVLWLDEYHGRAGAWPDSAEVLITEFPAVSELLCTADGRTKYLVDFQTLAEVGWLQGTDPLRLIAIQADTVNRSRLSLWFTERDVFNHRMAATSDGRFVTFGGALDMPFRNYEALHAMRGRE